jgi:hypothetical protein
MNKDLSAKFMEVDMELKYRNNDAIKAIIKHSRAEDIPIDVLIEHNLTHGRGYTGIRLPRNKSEETEYDLNRVLLAMDRLDGKIDPLKAQYEDARLKIKDKIDKIMSRAELSLMYSHQIHNR